MNDNILLNRIQKMKKELKKLSENASLLLCTGTEVIKSRDLFYDYKQDKNFYYLTNSQIKDCCLLIKANDESPVLLAPYQSKEDILWLGANESPKKLAQKINAKYIESSLSITDIISHLKNSDTLCYNSYELSISNRVAKTLLKENSAFLEKQKLPYKFINQDFLIAPLRRIKEKDEIENITTAVKITLNAIEELKNFLRPGITELDAKNFLDNEFKKHGGEIAFDTICAGGKNASTLHHTSTNKVLQKGELLLIDCGAEHNMYSADISRTLPVSGEYTSLQQTLINGVLFAQKNALKTAVTNAKYKDVQKAADLAIITLLLDLKILKTSKAKILKENLHREFFPHGVGHLLGLDTHDVGRLQGDDLLKKNMVITMEPGIYFSQKYGSILPLGIRIEDDVLVNDKTSSFIK